MSSTAAASTNVPTKRSRTPGSISDSDAPDEGRPHTMFRRARGDATGLQTPPPSSPVQVPHASPTSPDPPSLFAGASPLLLREVYSKNVQKRFPSLEVASLNDFQLLTLAGTRYEGPLDEIHAWFAHEFQAATTFLGGAENVMATSKSMLDEMAEVTGLKPEPGSPIAKLCAIHGSGYSLRLWPGSTEGREWCMDFVHSTTHEPVNSPLEFEVWTMPQPTSYPSGPWQPAEPRRVPSLENRFGMLTKDIPAGHEKFVLSDGQTYVLVCPTPYQNVQFTVPNRVQPVVASGARVVNF